MGKVIQFPEKGSRSKTEEQEDDGAFINAVYSEGAYFIQISGSPETLGLLIKQVIKSIIGKEDD